MFFQAHKGVSTEAPENTLPAIKTALGQGYASIEIDVSVTKDMQFVLLHDSTVNRTARLINGEKPEGEIKIGDITLEEALEFDFGSGFSKKFTSTGIALLKDALNLVKGTGVTLKIDNKYQRFSPGQKAALFELLEGYESEACLTCSDIDELEAAAKHFDKMRFHYDGKVNDIILDRLAHLLPKERLTVWLPLKCKNTSWVKVDFADEKAAKKIKKIASLGVWILSTPAQLAEAKALGADIIETNGELKPEREKCVLADMHTHSEHSHDSRCKIKDMLLSQKSRGTAYFAVTDHFDTSSYKDYDIFTPIKDAADEVKALNAAESGITVLSGVEIGEGFRHPEQYDKIAGLVDYDVVIGSVHLVRCPGLSMAYSSIDFSALDIKEAERLVDAYFDDVLTLIDKIDFDILAHLNCPLRYINGKYKKGLNLEKFSEKIEKILRIIIEKGIALEVNTSSFDMLGDFMPPLEIIRKYRELGGYLVTLGSDAHTAENASLHFDKAAKALKEAGFEFIFVYKNRQAYQLSL